MAIKNAILGRICLLKADNIFKKKNHDNLFTTKRTKDTKGNCTQRFYSSCPSCASW